MKCSKPVYLLIALSLIACSKEKSIQKPQDTPLTIKQQITKSDSIIAHFADSSILSSDPINGLKIAAERFKNLPQVEATSYERNHLAVKYKDGSFVFWLTKIDETAPLVMSASSTNKNIDNHQILSENNIMQSSNSSIMLQQDNSVLPNVRLSNNNVSINAYPKLLIVNQQSADESRLSLNGMISRFVNEQRSNGTNIEYIESKNFDLNFSGIALKGYDGIFINTHGCYSSFSGNTWILTGQEYNLNDVAQPNTARFTVVERKSGQTGIYEYYGVNEVFFDTKYKVGDFNNTVFFSGACQTFTDPQWKFAKIFNAKGVSKFIGFDETTYTQIAIDAGLNYFFTGLLSGEAYNTIYSYLPDNYKKQRIAPPYNVDANLVSSVSDMNYRFAIEPVVSRGWKTIVCGTNHSVGIKTDGSLWMWGTLINYSYAIPRRVGFSKDWKEIGAGAAHTIALKTDGSLWATGLNSRGELGVGTFTSIDTFARVGNSNDWLTISVGWNHTLALKKDSSLWAWGLNETGALGDGTNTNRNTPVRIGNKSDWKFISAGTTHSMAIKYDGSLWGWGSNYNGQLGIGYQGGVFITPTKIGTESWIGIYAGFDHTLGSKGLGIFGWGKNNLGQVGQLGTGTPTGDQYSPIQVTSGGAMFPSFSSKNNTSLAVRMDGSLWAWGDNTYGQFGNGTTTSSFTRVNTGGGTGDWLAVSTGESHSMAIKTDGSLWGWGRNHAGQLGDGTKIDRLTPVKISY